VECTNLRGARLWGTSLVGANLVLLDAGALEGARLLDAVLDQTRVRRDQFGKAVGEELDARKTPVSGGEVSEAELFDRASEVYRVLKVISARLVERRTPPGLISSSGKCGAFICERR
jgi:Pentapeptide repeats (8 copies)